jgi:hypothetical protein
MLMDAHIVYEHAILPDYGNNFIVYVLKSAGTARILYYQTRKLAKKLDMN